MMTDSDDEQEPLEVISYDVDELHPHKNVLVLCTPLHGDRARFARQMGRLPPEVECGFLTVFRLRAILHPQELPDMVDTFSLEEEHELQEAAARMRLEIAQVYLAHNTYSMCLLKTWWLRLVQRTWKRVYKERKAMLSSPSYLLHCQTFQQGNRMKKKFWIPGLRGMLAPLKGRTTATG